VTLISVVMLLALAAPEPAPQPAPPAGRAAEGGEEGYWVNAPPGKPEDVAIWIGLRDAQSNTMLHMGRIGQASFRIRYGRYYERLDEGARIAPDAAETTQLRSRIEIAAKQADDAIPKKGLRVRPCKYTLLHLDQRMRNPEDATMAADLPKVRTEARSCLDELTPFAARLAPLADSLERALDDADLFLDRDEPASPPSPPAPGQPSPTPLPVQATPPVKPVGARP
jgi:hypothetical protein